MAHEMDIKLTTQDIWFSTMIMIVADAIIVVPLLLASRNIDPAKLTRPVTGVSAVFWGVLAIGLIFGFWDFYYQYLFPEWIRWVTPLDILLYGAIGFGMWWLAMKLPGSAVLWFVFLGGIEGIGEHVLGIYSLHVLDKVPWLTGISPLSVIVFSFFEYILYWAMVVWAAWGCIQISKLFSR
jgi:hypothetical protein